MPFLVLIVVALFAGVELFHWIKGAILPLPVYVLAGAFLAIASNYGKGSSVLLNAKQEEGPIQMAVMVEPNSPTLQNYNNTAIEASPEQN